MNIGLRNVPTRLAAGGFIFHAGLGKWNAPPETQQYLHSTASQAYPFLGSLSPEKFTKALSVAEMSVGAALLTPLVSNRLAGLALTGFSGGLVGLYARTPGMREPGTIWPTSDGIPLAKDSWLLGIGLGLLANKNQAAKRAVS